MRYKSCVTTVLVTRTTVIWCGWTDDPILCPRLDVERSETDYDSISKMAHSTAGKATNPPYFATESIAVARPIPPAAM